MAAILDWSNKIITGGYNYSGQIAYDGTYVWFLDHASNNTKTLYRFRHSTKTLVGPNGVGTGGVATQGQSTAQASFIVTDGTTLAVGTWEWVEFYSCATMAYLGKVAGSTNTTGYGTNYSAFDGTHFWVSSFFPSQAMHKITMAGGVTTLGNALPRMAAFCYANGYMWCTPGSNSAFTGIAHKMSLNGTVVFSVPLGNLSGYGCVALAYDSIRDEMILSLTGGEYLRMRCSDGAYIKPDGTVSATAQGSVMGATPYPNQCILNSGVGIIAVGDQIWVGGHGASVLGYSMQRRNANTGNASALWYKSLVHGVSDFKFVGTTLYASLGSPQYWAQAGLMWTEIEGTIPNLTDISPGLTPQHISLTFDNPVTATAPTLGPAAGELGVSGTTQISPTQVDVACVITPVPPRITTAKANTSGVDLVFDRPVDVGATPDYGTTVNNLRVVLAAPLSATEVQLAATVTSGTYEWLATPVVVTGVGVLPHVVTAWSESNTTFVLIFNEAVIESSAVNIANYAISPALDIISIEKMDSTTYRMHTSQQTGNTTYYVTLTGVIDPANNPI